MKKVLNPITKGISIPLGSTAVTLAIYATIQKKFFGSATTQTISNEEMNDTNKIVKYLEELGLLIEHVNETVKNEAKSQKGGFLFKL